MLEATSLNYETLSFTTLFVLHSCEGKYTFIGNGTGKGKKITFAEAWQGKLFKS